MESAATGGDAHGQAAVPSAPAPADLPPPDQRQQAGWADGVHSPVDEATEDAAATAPAEWGYLAGPPAPWGFAPPHPDWQPIPAEWGSAGGFATWPVPGVDPGCWPVDPAAMAAGPYQPYADCPPAFYGATLPDTAYAGWQGADEEQQAYMMMAVQQQQQQMGMMPHGACYPQPYWGPPPPQYVLYGPPHPPAYSISPPAPAPQHWAAGRLARKKKAALPAEPSFGCDTDGLDGGGSAVLLHSAEPSQAALGGEDQGGGDLASPRRGGGGGDDSPRSAQQAQQTQQPRLEYDKAPRQVGWRPYSFEDYRQRGFDPKAVPGGKYWALGGLDPARPPSDATWQAQQIKRDRQQQFGEAVSKSNRQRIAGQPPRPRAPPRPPGTDVRERAIHFSKTSVPKPSSFKSCKSQAGGSNGMAASAAAAVAATDAAQAEVEVEPGAAEAHPGAAAEHLAEELSGLVLEASEGLEAEGSSASRRQQGRDPLGLLRAESDAHLAAGC